LEELRHSKKKGSTVANSKPLASGQMMNGSNLIQ